MFFASCCKVFRGPDVDLRSRTGDPSSAARAQLFGLLHLFKSKDVAIKCSCSFFTAWRSFHLDMVYSNNCWGRFKHICVCPFSVCLSACLVKSPLFWQGLPFC